MKSVDGSSSYARVRLIIIGPRRNGVVVDVAIVDGPLKALHGCIIHVGLCITQTRSHASAAGMMPVTRSVRNESAQSSSVGSDRLVTTS